MFLQPLELNGNNFREKLIFTASIGYYNSLYLTKMVSFKWSFSLIVIILTIFSCVTKAEIISKNKKEALFPLNSKFDGQSGKFKFYYDFFFTFFYINI